MSYSHAKDQGQRSVSSEDRVETDGQIDGQTDRKTKAIALTDLLMWLVTRSQFSEVILMSFINSRQRRSNTKLPIPQSTDQCQI